MITVQEMMTANPVTLTRSHSLRDARMLMEEKKFRHIPIVDDEKKLIGLVTQRNVLANSVSQQTPLEHEAISKIESSTSIADIMTTELTTVTADIKIASAAQLVHHKKYGCLPVIDKNKQLIGIITDHDFVAITIQLLEVIEASEPLELEN